MRPNYLAVAERFVAELPKVSLGIPPSVGQGSDEPQTQTVPTPIASYRAEASPRCSSCGMRMSVIARGDLCGRCVANRLAPQPSEIADAPAEARLRGQVLLALDEHHYPSLTIYAGTTVGPGIEEWGPFLRDARLESLERVLKRLFRKSRKEEEDEPPALID